MRSSSLSVVLAMVLLGGVAGCAENPATPAGATTAPSTSASVDTAFPLTVTRRGGFAGVDDSARLTADGSAVVTRRGQTPVQTSLPPDAMDELGRLLTAPGFTGRATPSGTPPVCNDGYEYEITSPTASRVVYGCGTSDDAPLDRMVSIVSVLFNT